MRGEFIDLSGERLYYYAAGTRGAGDTLVLLHGFPTSGHLWSAVVPLLPPGHRVVVADLLGFGRSDTPPHGDYGLDAHARRVVALLDTLGIRQAALAGHHFGAGIATAVAAAAPDRVTRLGLVSPIGFDATATGTLALIRAFLPWSGLAPGKVMRRAVARALERQYVNADRGRHSVDLYLRPFFPGRGRYRHFLRVLSAFSAADTSVAIDRVAAAGVPSGICVGAEDTLVPPAVARRLAALLPDAAVDMIDHVRHFAPEEAPERVAGFLAQLLEA
jgi:pimeloyl-ACP methyl ester carboxylesterase